MNLFHCEEDKIIEFLNCFAQYRVCSFVLLGHCVSRSLTGVLFVVVVVVVVVFVVVQDPDAPVRQKRPLADLDVVRKFIFH